MTVRIEGAEPPAPIVSVSRFALVQAFKWAEKAHVSKARSLLKAGKVAVPLEEVARSLDEARVYRRLVDRLDGGSATDLSLYPYDGPDSPHPKGPEPRCSMCGKD